MNKITQETDGKPNGELFKQVYFFIWGFFNINRSTKKPMENSMENPPNKFTFSLGAKKT